MPHQLSPAEIEERDALIRKRLLQGVSRAIINQRISVSWDTVDRVYKSLVAKPTRKDTMEQIIEKLEMAVNDLKAGMESHKVEDLKVRFRDIIAALRKGTAPAQGGKGK